MLPSRNERSGLKRSDGSERSEAKVKGGDIALLTQSAANLNLRFQGADLGESNLQIWAMEVRAKYREMIFGVLKLKFDEDKACSLSSQILTKSAKSAHETSRKLFKI